MRDEAYSYKTYRVEWWTEVYEVDQYGMPARSRPLVYSAVFPTKDQAEADLRRIAKPHPYVKTRWVSELCKHEYHDCCVRRVEVEDPARLAAESRLAEVERERDRLREALAPFANAAFGWADYRDDEHIVEEWPGSDPSQTMITVGNLRAARAALSKEKA